jgi:CRISPR-associated protein Cmr6
MIRANARSGVIERSLNYCVPVRQLQDVSQFLDKLQKNVVGFPLLRELSPKAPDRSFRETWRKGNVEVWGRIAQDETDSEAVRWFHGAYQGSQSIYKSELTGKMSQIGRMWHRMYPRYLPPTAERTPPKATGEFVELLTIFPNRSSNSEEGRKTEEFLQFLRDRSDFQQLW